MLYFLTLLGAPICYSDDFSGYSDYFTPPGNTTAPQAGNVESGGIPSYVWTIIYVIVAILALALLTGLIILLIRVISRKRKESISRKRRKQNEELRKQVYASGTQDAAAQNAASAAQTLWYTSQVPVGGMQPGASAATVRRAAAEIPGETMAMLAERLRNYLESCGISVNAHDVGRILAAYASSGSVRVSDVTATNPGLIADTARMLSVFFGASGAEDPSPATAFLPADDSVPDHMRTEISIARSGVAVGQPACGIGADTFRGILRETEDEQYLPEEDWRLVDNLLNRCTGVWFSPARNRMIRSMECISSCMMATSSARDEALDYAMYNAMLPCIFQNGGPDAMRLMENVFDELFRNREMTLCRRFLQTHTFTGTV